MKQIELYLDNFQSIGLMSGTSMDGVDAAWIETDGLFHVKSRGYFSIKYDASFYEMLKKAEREARENRSLLGLEGVVRKIDQWHAKAVRGLLEKKSDDSGPIQVIGYHGQTLYHEPQKKITLQAGEPQMLADDLQIAVVGHIRHNDIIHGGQGAPIAPIYHQALAVRDNLLPAAVINCGGIANMTIITGKTGHELSGFDTGPGNGLLDRWVREKTKGQERMDKDGRYALAGKISRSVLEILKHYSCLKNNQNYYEQKPPKSLDIGDFYWIPELQSLSLEDGCATLAAFTAERIVDSFKFVEEPIRNVILAGGGWFNPVILASLKQGLFEKYGDALHIVCGDEVGWSQQYLEAELMAYLAVRRLKNQPITFPSTTGAAKPVVGGEIFYPH